MALSPSQLATLQALETGSQVRVCEYFKVEWDADDPAETKYYGSAAYHEVVGFANIGLTIEARLLGDPFRAFELQPDLRTEVIKLTFEDIDKTIRGKFQSFGSGVRCEVFLYYPQIEAHVSVWFGQLQAPKVYGWKKIETEATNGFRSREQKAPKRNRPPDHCPFTFGGLLPTADAIRSNGCPYDRHVGGTTGLYKTGTTPFSDCPRDEAACTARFGDLSYYGGFDFDASAIVSDQRTGYIAQSRGNASELKNPIRVIAGSKYVRAMQLLLWRREVNQSTPEHGWVATVWEVGEGPVRAIRNIRVNDKYIAALHLAVRLGERGQPRTHYAPDVSNYSSTAHFFARYGWVDPETISAKSLNAEAFVDGYRDVVVYNTAVAGNGLIGEYFDNTTHTAPAVGQRVDPNINFELSFATPMEGVPQTGFSVRWTGKITFDHTETYTIRADIDDGVVVTINGSEIINEASPGTYTGNFAATAATPYDIEVEFVQGSAPGVHPWECVLSWSSTSQALETIPVTAFTHTGSSGYYRQWTDDRVWWLLEFYTNQKFGMAYPHSRFNAEAWVEAAHWGRETVTFSNTFADGETRSFAHRRTSFDAVIEGRPIAELVVDICRSGRLSVPFQYDGEFEIAPLRPFTAAELAAAPVFRDTGEGRNIVWSGDVPDIELSQIPDDKVVNEVELTFEDRDNADTERPIAVDDPAQKLRAGRALGEDNLMTVPKKYSGFGVTRLNEAVKLGYGILWFGEFNEGGTQNNLKIKLTVPLSHALGVKRYGPIQVVSDLLDDFQTPQGNPFTYFRVLKIKKTSKNTAEITAQGYNAAKEVDFEIVTGGTPGTPAPYPPPVPPENPLPNPSPGPVEPPEIPTFGTVTYDDANGYISVQVT